MSSCLQPWCKRMKMKMKNEIERKTAPLSHICSEGGVLHSCTVIIPCIHCSLLFVVSQYCWSFPTLVVPHIGCSLPFGIPHCCWLFPIVGCSCSLSFIIPCVHHSPLVIICHLWAWFLPFIIPHIRHSLFFIVHCHWSSSAPPYLPTSRGSQAGWWCYVVQ